jgi:16S rRNA (cytosine967-C5)-methyltransferase
VNERLLSIASQVIRKSDREHPADAVLRAKLKEARGISRADGSTISGAVFAYYRWLGWLERTEPMEAQIRKAIELNDAYRKKPSSVSDADMRKAIPAWASGEVEVSTEWLRALQREPKLWLRARPGKGRELAEKLGECWMPGGGLPEEVLQYRGKEDLFRTPEFHAGEFELQDVNSQVVGLVCGAQPGETWWDACAGEGGKLLHLADLMQNKGLIWSSDRAEWRLKQLKRRAARAKVFNYRAALWNGGAKLPTKTKFDGVLVDAPCSGVGTWQRNPQGRWTTELRDVKELAEVQKQLLANAVPALKLGAKLVYSVCTLTRSETTEVAEAITQRFPELKPLRLKNPFKPDGAGDNALWLWPQETDGNGMFICAWRKEAAA